MKALIPKNKSGVFADSKSGLSDFAQRKRHLEWYKMNLEKKIA